jgi:hypothetical protein
LKDSIPDAKPTNALFDLIAAKSSELLMCGRQTGQNPIFSSVRLRRSFQQGHKNRMGYSPMTRFGNGRSSSTLYTAAMEELIPTMIFDYIPGSSVERASCSICGTEMPIPELPSLDMNEAMVAFCIEFVRHVRVKHPPN